MILGIIPARGGSKGIPFKNIRPLLGKPLIVWSIEAARRSLMLDRFIVSTDCINIAQIAVWAGAEVVMRPDELATDTATTLDVLRHHLSEIECDVVVLLQPTSPIRGNMIDSALETFFKVKCDSLATGFMDTVYEWKGDNTRRQDRPHYFHDDGCVYIWDSAVIKEGRWIGDKPHAMIVPAVYNLEIDTEADFWAVEGILSHV